MNNTEPQREEWGKELPLIKDKIQQIFKFLETADVSQWQGMNVFEVGDADSLYGILETAFEQALESYKEKLREKIRKSRTTEEAYGLGTREHQARMQVLVDLALINE